MIDLHTHILPGVDDGARTVDDAVEMARALVADGVTAVAATPHVRDDYPTTADTMLRAVEELRSVLQQAGVPIALLTGAELAHGRIRRLGRDELQRLTLAGTGRYLLVETPYYGWPPELTEQLLELRIAGFIPVLAHPERNGDVQDVPTLLSPLVHGGTLIQVTAASLDGRLGAASRHAALHLVEAGLAHMIASDAHTPDVRAAGMQSAVDALGGGPLTDWLTRAVPQAIVDGRALPERPQSPAPL